MTTANASRLLAACLALAAAGCGQKGPLTLPGDPGSIRTEMPPQAEPGPTQPVEPPGQQPPDDPDTHRPQL